MRITVPAPSLKRRLYPFANSDCWLPDYCHTKITALPFTDFRYSPARRLHPCTVGRLHHPARSPSRARGPVCCYQWITPPLVFAAMHNPSRLSTNSRGTQHIYLSRPTSLSLPAFRRLCCKGFGCRLNRHPRYGLSHTYQGQTTITIPCILTDGCHNVPGWSTNTIARLTTYHPLVFTARTVFLIL